MVEILHQCPMPKMSQNVGDQITHRNGGTMHLILSFNGFGQVVENTKHRSKNFPTTSSGTQTLVLETHLLTEGQPLLEAQAHIGQEFAGLVCNGKSCKRPTGHKFGPGN